MEYLKHENVWITKCSYEDAEIKYYENLAKAAATPLANEVAKARQFLIESRDSIKDLVSFQKVMVPQTNSIDPDSIKFLEKKAKEFGNNIATIFAKIDDLNTRLCRLEISSAPPSACALKATAIITPSTKKIETEDDDDVDLFNSDSDEDEAKAKIKEERLAAYNAKKSTKPALIAKSNVIFDVKPWDDETDMKQLEEEVRKIKSPGLLWGSAKLVPLAYGIHKLQISSVVEDELVSIDWLQEEITSIEAYVQSVDIAAFNKI